MLANYRLHSGERIGTQRRSQTPKLILALLFWSLGALILLLSTAPLEASQTTKSPLAMNEKPLENQHLK